MIKNHCYRILCLLLVLGMTSTTSAQNLRGAADPGSAALAERVAQMAHLSLSGQIVDSTLRQAATLLEAATRIHPGEPRFHRLLIDAYLEMGDVPRAIDALTRYRQLEPADEAAQIQLINLYVSQMESADERLTYLRDLSMTQGLSEVVRAHAAARAAVLHAERAQETHAQEMVQQALELSSVNLDALQLQYAHVMQRGDPAEQTRAILAWLRGNPAQPELMAQLAQQLAAAGLPDQATNWYTRSFAVYQAFGQPISPAEFTDFAAAQYLAGQVKLADASLMQLLEAAPDVLDAWFLRLVIARDQDNPEQTRQLLDRSRRALVDRINALHGELSGSAPATSPGNLSEQLPNLLADAKQLEQVGDPQLRSAYAAAVGDLAWHQIYFARDAAPAAPLVEALRAMVPRDSVIVPRLEGWSFLVNQQADEARVKLSAIADRDPLAALGLLLLEQDDRPAERAEQALRLIGRHRSGVMGALLVQALRGDGGKIVPSDEARRIAEEIATFPEEWLDVTQRPDKFYKLTAQATRVAHQYGEPVLARLSLQNISEYPITIDQRGLLRPDLWFDAQLRGVAQQTLMGVAYDRVSQRTVLRPRESITQMVRVDRGQAAQMLARNPLQFVPINYSVVLNPISSEQGIRFGPGGTRAFFDRVVERVAAPLRDLPRVINEMTTADAPVKIRNMDLLSAYVQMIRATENAPEELRKLVPQLLDAIDAAGGDASPSVQSYALFTLAQLAAGERQQRLVQQMAASDRFERRMLAVTLATLLAPEPQNALLDQLTGDEDATVSRYARATADTLATGRESAATQPAPLPLPGVLEAPATLPAP